MIVTVDPGETNIGFCLFTGDEKKTGKVNLAIKTILHSNEDLFDVLQVAEGMVGEGLKINTVVCENYRIRPPGDGQNQPRGRSTYGRSQYGSSQAISAKDFWSEVKTIRLIGAMQFFAYRVGATFVLQEPGILAMARKWCDFPMNKGHIQDDVSAYCHGAHFMMKSGLIKSVDDIAKFGQEVIR